MKRGTYLKSCGILVFLLSTTFSSSEASTISVDDDGPADFNTIQAAIDDANDGDTIIVSDGTYTGDGNRDIDFLGKAITLRSENGPQNCIINCQGSEADPHRGFNFHNGETYSSVLTGLTVTNGWGVNGEGGGIYCTQNSSPTISKCRVTDNWAGNGGGICCSGGSSPTIRDCTIYNNSGYGGGIYCGSSSPTITNCVIRNNVAPLWNGMPFEPSQLTDGGGIYCAYSSPTITNCIITRNTAAANGGGIYCWGGTPIMKNCTIIHNSADRDGGGIRCSYQCVLNVGNCILWGNTAARYGPQISMKKLLDGCPTLAICYSNVQGGQSQINIDLCVNVNWGPGNIDVDPNFADTSSSDPNDWDYHLKSQAGRWEPSLQVWVQDTITSPCIDGGDPDNPIGDEPFPNGGVINMGAYGGTTEASKSYFGQPVCETIVAGDVNGDCIVNYLDFRLMALNWLRDENK